MMRNGEPNIDDFVNYESEYRPHVKKATVLGVNMTGCCPFHNDHNKSFSVDLKTGRWHCFTEEIGGNFLDFYGRIHGCDTKEAYQQILRQYGKDEEKPKTRDYTLDQYAKDKHLPKEWLETFCNLATEEDRKDKITFLKIQYYDQDGKPTVYRKRYARKEFKWQYGSGGKINLYGEWQIESFREDGYVILVEGESDAQSLWYMGLPALGVPGASMFKPEHAEILAGLKVFLHKEKDAGGETFISKTLSGLRMAGFEGKLFTFSCGDIEHCKDPSDVLIRSDREAARNQIDALIKSAQPIGLNDPDPIPIAIHGAPVNLRTPGGYFYNESGIYRIEKNAAETLICGTPILFTRRINALDTEEEKIEIAFLRTGKHGKKWRKAILPRSTIFTTAKCTIVLTDLGCMVSSENVKPLIRFLSMLEVVNDDVIPWGESTSTFGWQPGNRFIPGNGGDIILDIDQAQSAIAAAYHARGSFEEWKKTMQRHRDNYKFRFILATAFAAPLLKLLHQRSFVLYNWGDSRGGKTAALKASLSAWGDPEGLMINFNTTQVGLERTAAFFSDLPLGIDERQAAGSGQYGQSKIENLVYMIGEGKGRTRGGRDGGVQKVNRWRTIAIATGEEPVTTGTSQTGVSTRVLEICQGPFASEEDAGRMHQESGKNCGWAGPAFIEKLLDIQVKDLQSEYDRMMDYVRSISAGKAGSHVAGIAVVALADALADGWIFGQTDDSEQKNDQNEEKMPIFGQKLTISPESWKAACLMAREIMKEQLSAAAGNVNENAVQFLVDWVLSNRAYFGEKAIGTCLGMLDDDEKTAYIYPSALNSALRKEGYNERKTKKYMADKGLIRTEARKDNPGESYSTVKRFQGRAQRFVAFYLDRASGLDQEPFPNEFAEVGEDDDLPFE